MTTKALAALDTAQQEPVNEWKDAVIDALVVAHILTPENAIYPRKAVQDVIDWNCQVALDPRVSSKAQALVDSGKSVQVNAMLVEALQAAEKLEHEALVALSEATDELKVGNTYTTATDTYKAHNDLIHRLDKILNSQYRDRKRAALTAAQQAQLDPFTPDWSQDSAAAESIREHQAICNLLLKEMRHIAGISTGQVKRAAEQALEAVKQAQPERAPATAYGKGSDQVWFAQNYGPTKQGGQHDHHN